MLTVLYFGVARERVGVSQEEFPANTEALSVAELRTLLEERHPALKRLRPYLRIAVNQELMQDADVVPDGAEVALIPPVAGGAGVFSIRAAPLHLEEVIKAVASDARGGLVTFSGAVRGTSHGKRVLRLEYEAYGPMAEKSLREIGQRASALYPGTGLAILHRVGTLLPGELAVVMAAAAPHRKEAFLACEYGLEQLKAVAPIWKKEWLEDGAVWVGLGA